jgi:hypothetical protein
MINTTYNQRNVARQQKLEEATQSFLQYLIDEGSTEIIAKRQINSLSNELSSYLFIYILGNKQPLINGVESSRQEFMDDGAKNYAIQLLS